MAEAPVVEKVARQAKKICGKVWSDKDSSLRHKNGVKGLGVRGENREICLNSRNSR